MSMSSNLALKFLIQLRQIFNLRRDTDEDNTVENIRKNVDFNGANAWTLVFAIFVASIGLNMNSAAVIIGAMLISPLMGPILGFGLALGINDSELLKRSLRNLSIAVLISIVTSTLYFLLSPLEDAQSELLARTQPTFYDVLIAFFGGAAGIISISRKERGAAVAGVAIATALMPPLCTAGYALSIGNFGFFAGALYLFLINSVFIGLSTFTFVRYLSFKKVKIQNDLERRRLRKWLTSIVVIVVFPSLILAWSLMKQSHFNLMAERFVREKFQFKNSFVVNKNLSFRHDKPVIEVSLIGTTLTKEQLDGLKALLPLYKLDTTELKVRQLVSGEAQNSKNEMTRAEAELVELRQKMSEHEFWSSSIVDLENELKVIHPNLERLIATEAGYHLIWKKRLAKKELATLESFIKLRTKNQKAQILHLTRF